MRGLNDVKARTSRPNETIASIVRCLCQRGSRKYRTNSNRMGRVPCKLMFVLLVPRKKPNDVKKITSDIAKRLWRDDITYISQLNDGMMEVCLRQANQRLGEQGYSDVTDSEFRWRMNRALTNLRIEESAYIY